MPKHRCAQNTLTPFGTKCPNTAVHKIRLHHWAQNAQTPLCTKYAYTIRHKMPKHRCAQNTHTPPCTKCPGPTLCTKMTMHRCVQNAHTPPRRTRNGNTPPCSNYPYIPCTKCPYTAVHKMPRPHAKCPYTAVRHKMPRPHAKCPYTAVHNTQHPDPKWPDHAVRHGMAVVAVEPVCIRSAQYRDAAVSRPKSIQAVDGTWKRKVSPGSK